MKFFSLNKKKYATLTVKENKSENKKVEEKEEKIIKKTKITGLWEKCPECHEIVYKNDIEQNLQKCPHCDYYFSMSAKERISLLIDEGTFQEMDKNLVSENPLDFPGYTEKYEAAVEKTGMLEGVVAGIGDIFGIKVSIAVMDFEFLGGSMGSVVGEKITRAIERGIKFRIPVVIVASSGGARMHEGILSLMQMAKTSAALEKLREAGLPFISIPVNPTTGGVTASFAMLGDIIMTEPDALIGFAGQRVIEQTIKQKLPNGFQRSEFLQECGMVDVITKREDMKRTLHKVLDNII
ncbi:acetyl-CoA carboxylase, carboxyltransferase subunit beta [Cetobacterium somerae]|uniref:acetyl-CoA carboxylase, carboxyltransferase subunit beta n=1 Tax=Cetobacterium sp. NK01 TaxID=2993530 RepID=UPI002116F6EE|nr:acetyl-CoA carboxylase, carboxyltransferase subunit beta [Cetobacterium sp. NK01]MCQ8212364.1 acetyl-CoA carboxylase, carboxyltransferase subunit beta [Cetobacterium sp. NK01]